MFYCRYIARRHMLSDVDESKLLDTDDGEIITCCDRCQHPVRATIIESSYQKTGEFDDDGEPIYLEHNIYETDEMHFRNDIDN